MWLYTHEYWIMTPKSCTMHLTLIISPLCLCYKVMFNAKEAQLYSSCVRWQPSSSLQLCWLVRIRLHRLKSACTSQVEQTSLALSRLSAPLANSVSTVSYFISTSLFLLCYLINELNYSRVLRFLSPRHSLFLSLPRLSDDASREPHLTPPP